MGDRQWFVLYVLVCLEVGIFLILVPWSAIWERNYFLDSYPQLRPLLLSPSLKGAVCGLGVANIYVALTEVLKRLHASAAAELVDTTTEATPSTARAFEPTERDASAEPTAPAKHAREPVHEET